MNVHVEVFLGMRNDAMCENCDWHYDGQGVPAKSQQHAMENPTHKVTRVCASKFVYSAENKKTE